MLPGTVDNLVVDLINGSIGFRSPEGIGRSFFAAIRQFGASAINARSYTNAHTASNDEHVFYRAAPPSFMPVYEEPWFYRFNPLPVQARQRSAPFKWSEIDWNGVGALWVRNTMHDCGCPDGIIVPCHGPGNYLGIISIAFDNLNEISPNERSAIEIAGAVLHNRMVGFQQPLAATAASLTSRERDCLLFVSDGRSDREIAKLLGISATTVATHIVKARRKLGAKTRAQAVAAMTAKAFR